MMSSCKERKFIDFHERYNNQCKNVSGFMISQTFPVVNQCFLSKLRSLRYVQTVRIETNFNEIKETKCLEAIKEPRTNLLSLIIIQTLCTPK